MDSLGEGSVMREKVKFLSVTFLELWKEVPFQYMQTHRQIHLHSHLGMILKMHWYLLFVTLCTWSKTCKMTYEEWLEQSTAKLMVRPDHLSHYNAKCYTRCRQRGFLWVKKLPSLFGCCTGRRHIGKSLFSSGEIPGTVYSEGKKLLKLAITFVPWIKRESHNN